MSLSSHVSLFPSTGKHTGKHSLYETEHLELALPFVTTRLVLLVFIQFPVQYRDITVVHTDRM